MVNEEIETQREKAIYPRPVTSEEKPDTVLDCGISLL